MPKRVDHQQRREQIATALMRVAAEQGLEAVSLRHVAAEAGVTSGMVQHYFPTKEAMMRFAMKSASARYEQRMTAAVVGLGEAPRPRELVGAMLETLLPLDEAGRDDGRVALAFMSYAATKPQAAEDLGGGNSGMREFVTDQIRMAQTGGGAPVGQSPEDAATGLFAMTEGLAVHLLSSGLSADAAVAALRSQLDITFGAR